MNIADYVAAHTVEDAGCLRWTGASVARRHPVLYQPGGRQLLVRRLVVEARGRPIPPGMIVRCTCETPLCVADACLRVTTYGAVAREVARLGLMGGLLRSARVAATKRGGPQAKLTDAAVQAIRTGDEPGTVLARRYGVCEGTISKIRRGQMRRDFASPWLGLARGPAAAAPTE